jgi:hypothetical protein
MAVISDLKNIERFTLNNKECLKLNLNGILNQKDAIRVCSEWKAIAELDKTKKFVVILNAKNMIDYEPMTRNSFQNTMKELKNQIDQIWVVSNSNLIRGGAAIMGLLTSFTIKAVDSEDLIVL